MVPADLQIATKSTYKTNKSRVSTNIGSGEWFTTQSGVRQGSIISPILFVMCMDSVIKEVHQNNPENDFVLAYADDIAQTATSIEKLQERMTRWNESFNRYNLKLNLKKTEVLVVSRTEKEAVVTLDENQLNQVTKFKYLGCIIGSKGHIDEEINGRISKMSQNVGITSKTTVKKVLHLHLKGKMPRGRPRTSWLMYIDNILKERGTNLKVVEYRGIHLNRIAWRTFLTN